jgi:hypothetical protein
VLISGPVTSGRCIQVSADDAKGLYPGGELNLRPFFA